MELLVRPKLALHNLFLLLDVGLPETAWRPEVFSFGTDRNLLPAVASFFARTLERVVASGLRRDYRPEIDELVALRGRIDVASQFRRSGLAMPVVCAFDEYTADIPENRYLKAAVRRLLQVPGVTQLTRRSLLHELARFEEVADVAVDPDLPERLVVTRLNLHYQPALRLARLVLHNLTLLDRIGATDASSFLLDMNDLFQRFVTARLRRHLRGKLALDAEPPHHLGRARLVPMKPDLVFLSGDMSVYVGDVKYKLTGSGLARSNDYYQLLAYTTALELAEGVLVYCQADGETPPREVVVRHAGKRLWTAALPMQGTAAEVDAGLLELAAWILARSTGVSQSETTPD